MSGDLDPFLNEESETGDSFYNYIGGSAVYTVLAESVPTVDETAAFAEPCGLGVDQLTFID